MPGLGPGIHEFISGKLVDGRPSPAMTIEMPGRVGSRKNEHEQ
jgi:hypothetical protein